MKAVFETGGKQYYVSKDDEIYVEKLNVKDGDKIEFTTVLSANGKTGDPYIKGAKVICEVIKSGKAKKIKVFKYKQKNQYRKTQGHRQPYTKLLVKDIVS